MAIARHSLAAGLFALLSYGAAALGGIATRGRPRGLWYRMLRKPSFQPPPSVFGPVWTVLYGAIAYTGYRLYRAEPSRMRTAALGLWGAQLALNAAWSPLFFGARRARLALVDLIALDVATAAMLGAASKVDRRAAIASAPYGAWLGFATALNGAIVQRNPRWLAG